jgi:hypothetical protein
MLQTRAKCRIGEQRFEMLGVLEAHAVRRELRAWPHAAYHLVEEWVIPHSIEDG